MLERVGDGQIKLRGHHLRKRTSLFWNELGHTPGLRIKLVDAPDYLCVEGNCPKRRAVCSSPEYSADDLAAIKDLGLELGGVYTIEEIRQAIDRKCGV